MKTLSIAVVAGLVFSMCTGNGWSADNEVLCGLWNAHRSALNQVLNQRRNGNQMREFHADLARSTTIRELQDMIDNGKPVDHLLDGSGKPPERQKLSDAEAVQVKSWFAQISGPYNSSALSRVNDEIAKFQDRTLAVYEEDLKWKVMMKGMNIQVLPVAKAEYPAFAQRIITTLVELGNYSLTASLRQELPLNPLSLSEIIPGPAVQVANCGNTYLIYQPNSPKTVSGAFSLGNLTKIHGNNVSVSGYPSEK